MSCENYNIYSPIRLVASMKPRYLNPVINELPAIKREGGIPSFEFLAESNLNRFSDLFMPENGWRVFLERQQRIKIPEGNIGRAVRTFHGAQGAHFLMAVWDQKVASYRSDLQISDEALVVLLSDNQIKQTALA